MADWSHLVTVVPADCTPYNLRVVENVPVGLMFVGCVAEQRCIETYGIVNPYEFESGPVSVWQCNTCSTIYMTRKKTTATMSKDEYYTLDGKHWLSVWLGVEDHHTIQVSPAYSGA